MRLLLLAAVLAATPAVAKDRLSTMTIANSLGNVIASEKTCGLSYDQGAIERYIETKVDADDMEFPAMLDMMVSGSSISIDEMSSSAKTAHCAQVRRIAKSYRFTQ